jgi:SNF2 family DNA or RNA helicase
MSEPWPHQLDFVDFAVKYKKVAAAHDTGTGKSRSAVKLADRIKAKRILVLCPTLAATMLRDQFHEWGEIPRIVTIARNGTSDLTGNVVIVPFDLLSTESAIARRLAQYVFDLVIIDEAHALKTPEAKRTRAAYGSNTKSGGVAHTAPYVVLLSGTLMPNHAAELWPHLSALRPELLGEPGRDSFIERYCTTKTVWRGSTPHEQITGIKMGPPAKDLHKRLATFVHRVHKEDVLKDLPPVLWTVVPVHVASLSIHEDMLRDWRVAEARLLKDIGSATGEEALAIAAASPYSATQRRLTGLIKLQAMIEALHDELEPSTHKVISFAYHRSVLEAIEERLSGYGVVTIDGRTPQDARPNLVRQFQTDRSKRIFNGQINTAGESIDLTASSSVWIMENDWTPKTLTQAVGRAHRHGQKSSVNARILALEGSIDLALSRTVARKARDVETIMEPV